MKKIRARWLSGVLVVSSVVVSVSARVAPFAATALLPACDAYDCSPHACSEYGSGGNGNSFNSCCACGSDDGASIELRDPSGKAFYHCDDQDGKTCSTDPGYLSAIETYCGF